MKRSSYLIVVSWSTEFNFNFACTYLIEMMFEVKKSLKIIVTKKDSLSIIK